jgi:hypothetical protein
MHRTIDPNAIDRRQHVSRSPEKVLGLRGEMFRIRESGITRWIRPPQHGEVHLVGQDEVSREHESAMLSSRSGGYGQGTNKDGDKNLAKIPHTFLREHALASLARPILGPCVDGGQTDAVAFDLSEHARQQVKAGITVGGGAPGVCAANTLF